ncbi:hypothetical protein B0J14DRAFT_556901 [Halenospora varia]|nr:hypothetical protein B0J14DRAFT_556901 [Halenospora varia]
MSTVASALFGNGGRNILVATVLAASLVSGETVVNLLLGDSSIGDSDIRVVGGVLHGSIIGVDSTATTYDVNCALTNPVSFPFTTPACVTGAHVTITQGPSTAFVTQVFVTASTSKNYRQGCTFSTSNTATCSITNTVSATIVSGGKTVTTSFTETSSGVNAAPSNPPLYFPVTITAGLEKLGAVQAKATVTPAATGTSSSSTVETRTLSGATQAIANGKWTLLSSVFMIAYFAL